MQRTTLGFPQFFVDSQTVDIFIHLDSPVCNKLRKAPSVPLFHSYKEGQQVLENMPCKFSFFLVFLCYSKLQTFVLLYKCVAFKNELATTSFNLAQIITHEALKALKNNFHEFC